MVLKILENKVYLGMVVNGKYRVTKVGGNQFKRVADEEQVCVSGRHEAIVTEQEFLKASEVIKYRGCQRGKEHKGKQDSILLGKLRCGNCKRSLNRIVCTKVPCFVCGRAKYDKGGGCFSGRIMEPEAEEVVLKYINQRLEKQYKEQECKGMELPEQDGGSSKQDIVQKKNKGALLEKKLDALKVEKQYLYEHFKQVDRDLYLNKVGELREEERVICEEIRRAKEEKDRDREGQENQSSFQKVDGLTKEIVKQMIDVIYVNEEGEFEVIWKK